MRAFIVVGIALSLLSSLRAAEAVLCKTRGRAVVLRDACRGKEVPMDLSVIGAPGPEGAAGADGPVGAWTVGVVDAQAHPVGPAVHLEWYQLASAEQLPGVPMLYALVRNDAVGGAALLGVDALGQPAGTVYYASGDCTGQPLLIGEGFMPVLEVIGDTMFVPGPPAASTTVHSSETINTRGGCIGVTARGGCCHALTGTYSPLHLATTTSFGALGITPPLRAVGP